MSNITDTTTQPQDVSKTNDKELNFAAIRKQLEQSNLARQQAEERAAAAERLVQESRQSRPTDDDRDDEPYVDHRKLEKKFAKFEQDMDKKIDQKAEQKAAMMIDQERRNDYLNQNTDFNEIMNSEEVLQKFADKHPKLAKSILRMPDGFERQKLVYENIKALGVNKKDSAPQTIQQKIDANRKSPYYQPAGTAAAPYASEGNYSPSGQKDAYAKMQELKRNLRL